MLYYLKCMSTFLMSHLDPAFTANFSQKRLQYARLGCLPDGVDTPEALIRHTLQLMEGVCPVLAGVLHAELAAGNHIRTVCKHLTVELLDITLVRPFTKRYKAKHLEYLLVKDPHYGPDPAFHYHQYTSLQAPLQRLTASLL